MRILLEYISIYSSLHILVKSKNFTHLSFSCNKVIQNARTAMQPQAHGLFAALRLSLGQTSVFCEIYMKG